VSAALLARLIEAGTPAELVGEVAMELARAQAIQEQAEKRKTKDRERKRNSADSTENAEIQENPCSLEVSPQTPLPKPINPSPLNPPIFEEKREAVASCLRRAYPPPEGVTEEQWEAFRKQRKKALNERSYALLSNKLAELSGQGHKPGALIDLAIERGWETVFPPRDFDKGSAPAKITDKAQIAANKRGMAAIYDRQGRRDEAAQLRREAAQLEQQAA
jgi:hypothetical protein